MYPETIENQEIDIVKNNKTYTLYLTATPKDFNTAKNNFDVIISSFKLG